MILQTFSLSSSKAVFDSQLIIILWYSVKTVGVVALETTVHRPSHFSTAVMSLLVEMSFLLAPSNAAVL